MRSYNCVLALSLLCAVCIHIHEHSYNIQFFSSAAANACSFPLYGSGACTIAPQGTSWTITNDDTAVSVLVEIREHDLPDVLLAYSLRGNWSFVPVDSESDAHDYVIFDALVQLHI